MIDIVPFNGWKNNVRLSNGATELIATLDVGPRILSYSMVGGSNPLNVYADQGGATGEDVWRNRGGHRLWMAPEDRATTYFPDNAPVALERVNDLCIRLTPAPETPVGIQKQIEITLAPTGTKATLTHRLTCLAGAKPITLAPWALTVMAAGGVAIMPQPPLGEHPRDLLPNRTWILWPYSDLTDPRWSLGSDFVLLRQEPDCPRSPTKIGMALEAGVCGYLHNGVLFIKRFPFDPRAASPDKGCNFEAFTNVRMLEVESLAPLVTLQPGQTAEHIEHWELREAPATLAADLPALRAWLAKNPL
jgi:hypothetical protein